MSETTSNSVDPTKPKGLNKEIIRKKALEIADREGIENLSVRKLAKELGKTPMALYRHYDSIDDIRQAAMALAFEEVDADPIPGERWDDTLRRATTSIKDMSIRHSKAHFHLMHVSAWSPALKSHTERIQNLHSNQGIPPEILTQTWRIIDAFLDGFNANASIAADIAAEDVPVDQPGWIDTARDAYTDQAFKDGIEIIIAGIRSLAAPDPCDWHTPEAEGNKESKSAASMRSAEEQESHH